MTPVPKLHFNNKDELYEYLKGCFGDKLAIDYKIGNSGPKGGQRRD